MGIIKLRCGNKNMKRLIILAGANGTGKTTLAKELLKEHEVSFLNADEIAKKMGRGNKDFSKFRITAGKKFILELHAVLKKRGSVAIESTLSGGYLVRTIKQVRRMGYRVSIIYVFVDNPQIALQRIKARVKAGGHDVPETDVLRRFFRSKSNFWRVYKDIADDWTIFYNGMERLVAVATGQKSSFEVSNEELFTLFKRNVKNDK